MAKKYWMKKFLAVTISATMVIGMLAIGASAAPGDDKNPNESKFDFGYTEDNKKGDEKKEEEKKEEEDGGTEYIAIQDETGNVYIIDFSTSDTFIANGTYDVDEIEFVVNEDGSVTYKVGDASGTSSALQDKVVEGYTISGITYDSSSSINTGEDKYDNAIFSGSITLKDEDGNEVPGTVDEDGNIVPKDETPKDETPKDETPKDETPKDETPKDETPKDETPKDETPKDETPKGETPKGETPKGETPKDETPKGETPKDETPKDETPKDEISNDENPKDETPKVPEKPEPYIPTYNPPEDPILDPVIPTLDPLPVPSMDSDPDYPPYIPPVTPELNPVEIVEEEAPLADIADDEVPLSEEPQEELEDLPDEEVPLADVPKTGDPMMAYAAVTGISALAWVALKKKEEK